MRIYAGLYRNLIVWELRRFKSRSARPAAWNLVRWPYIILGYGGVFICSLPILFGLPFGLIAALFGSDESLTTWFVLTGLVTAGTFAYLCYVIFGCIQWLRVGRFQMDLIIFSAGLLFTLLLQVTTMFIGPWFLDKV